MKKIIIAALFSVLPSIATAAVFTANFPSNLSSVTGSVGAIDADEVGYFWSVSRGDQVSQSFLDTGLFNAGVLSLDLNVTRNVLNDIVEWDVLVNGVDVGDWAWTAADGTGWTHLSYAFAPTAGDDYFIQLAVKNEVPSGWGSIALGTDSTLTLAPVPEPETYAMMGAGLLAVAFARRRRLQRV